MCLNSQGHLNAAYHMICLCYRFSPIEPATCTVSARTLIQSIDSECCGMLYYTRDVMLKLL